MIRKMILIGLLLMKYDSRTRSGSVMQSLPVPSPEDAEDREKKEREVKHYDVHRIKKNDSREVF